MNVELIFGRDCPNAGKAREFVQTAFAQTGIRARWKEWDRADPGCPDFARSFGSPTILVNGADVGGISPNSGRIDSCRVYAGEDGGFDGVPSLDLIVRALADTKPRRNEHGQRARSLSGPIPEIPGDGAIFYCRRHRAAGLPGMLARLCRYSGPVWRQPRQRRTKFYAADRRLRIAGPCAVVETRQTRRRIRSVPFGNRGVDDCDCWRRVHPNRTGGVHRSGASYDGVCVESEDHERPRAGRLSRVYAGRGNVIFLFSLQEINYER